MDHLCLPLPDVLHLCLSSQHHPCASCAGFSRAPAAALKTLGHKPNRATAPAFNAKPTLHLRNKRAALIKKRGFYAEFTVQRPSGCTAVPNATSQLVVQSKLGSVVCFLSASLREHMVLPAGAEERSQLLSPSSLLPEPWTSDRTVFTDILLLLFTLRFTCVSFTCVSFTWVRGVTIIPT